MSEEAETRSKTLKVATTVGILYGCFMLCWLPISIFATGLAWFPNLFTTAHAWPHVVLAEILPVLNSTMNPVIYSLKNKVCVFFTCLPNLLIITRQRLHETRVDSSWDDFIPATIKMTSARRGEYIANVI